MLNKIFFKIFKQTRVLILMIIKLYINQLNYIYKSFKIFKIYIINGF